MAASVGLAVNALSWLHVMLSGHPHHTRSTKEGAEVLWRVFQFAFDSDYLWSVEEGAEVLEI
jgi:hypothetical protein